MVARDDARLRARSRARLRARSGGSLRFGMVVSAMLAVAGSVACSALLDTASLSAGGGATAEGGSASGSAGSAGVSGATAAGASGAGASAGSAGVANTGGAAGAPDCVPTGDTTEYCDGVDNDCDPLTPDVCPTHCTAFIYKGTSYMTCTDPHSWDASETRCQLQLMHLTKIDDTMENAFVLSLGKSLAQRVWIGGSDEALNGTFVWTDGSSTSTPYENFASGQPSDTSAADCLQIYTSSGTPEGQWLSAVCSSNAPYICERY